MPRSRTTIIATIATTGLLLLTAACGGGDSTSVDKDALVDKVISTYYAGQDPAPDCIRGELDKLSGDDLTELSSAVADAVSDPPQIQSITSACVGTEAPADQVEVTTTG